MKKLLLAVMTLATLATSTLSPMNMQAAAITNKDVIKQYIEENFMIEADYRTVFVKSEKLTNKMLKQRRKNGIIYVEKITSTSCGTYGRTDDGGFVRYNKKTRIGKKVKSFLVYNPESKAVDDVIAVVDRKMIR